MEKGDNIWRRKIDFFRGEQQRERKWGNIFGDQKYVIAVEKIDSRGKRYLEKVSRKGKGGSFAKGRSIRMIICKRPAYLDDHLQEASPPKRSFARGWWIWIIICKRSSHPDDHLQNADPSRMIICERLVHHNDHLQEVSQSGWSFARGRSILMIICKTPVIII